jgi:hypothetical protein
MRAFDHYCSIADTIYELACNKQVSEDKSTPRFYQEVVRRNNLDVGTDYMSNQPKHHTGFLGEPWETHVYWKAFGRAPSVFGFAGILN